MSFIHVNCQSEYSITNSLVRTNKLVDLAKQHKMSAVGITDKMNVFSAIKFYKKALQEKIKPLIGAQIFLDKKTSTEDYCQFILLCLNNTGYINLSKIISNAYLENKDFAVVKNQWLEEYNEGLLLIAPPLYSDVADYLLANSKKNAYNTAKYWQGIFVDRYYLGLQRIGNDLDEKHISLTLPLACELNLPVVALNSVQFLANKDYEAHQVRVCIANSQYLDSIEYEKNIYTKEQYFKSSEVMHKLFIDIPSAIENVKQITIRCNLKFDLDKKTYLPDIPLPKGFNNIAGYLTSQTQESLSILFNKNKLPNQTKDIYKKRIEYELSVINGMNFSGYFLIVSDFIRWAKRQNIAVGPGRGSGAGSLVAYLLDITTVDPIKYDLLFERFLNPQRVSMPDIDIDFCTKRRDEVIQYVANLYGKDRVCNIITYGTMAARAVIRDVGRVLNYPYNFCDTLAKLIPNKLNITLEQALASSQILVNRYNSEQEVAHIIDMAKILEGLVRNVSTHAGGVVISPLPITNFCPIYKTEQDTISVSQFDKKDVEDIGLVKFDFLGLNNLTMIEHILEQIKKIHNKKVDLTDITDIYDKKTYALLQKGYTSGIFQFESFGITSYLKKLKPDNFNDIADMLALYRPSVLKATARQLMEMLDKEVDSQDSKLNLVDYFIKVKNKEKSALYPHTELKEILSPTNGIFVYQEQVMQAVQKLASFSLAKADMLRRAIGTKNKKEMAILKDDFIIGATKNSIKKHYAIKIFELIDNFAGYGFNKSHSVSYAIISYQTAYLKAHYPDIFMAALFTNAGHDAKVISSLMRISRRQHNFTIIPPDINLSESQFICYEKDTILFGLQAIKNVGEAFIKQLIKERQQNGKYKSFLDFCHRFDNKYLNRKTIESLIYSGALNDFGTMQQLLQMLPNVIKFVQNQNYDKNIGQSGLFGSQNNFTNQDFVPSSYSKDSLWTKEEILFKQYNNLGLFFADHPVDLHNEKCRTLGLLKPSQLLEVKKSIRLFGFLSDFIIHNSNNSNSNEKSGYYISVFIDDIKEQVSVNIRLENILDKVRILNNKLVVVNLKREYFTNKLSADFITDFDTYTFSVIKFLKIKLSIANINNFSTLKQLLNTHKGTNTQVVLYYYAYESLTECFFRDFAVDITKELLTNLENLFGKNNILT